MRKMRDILFRGIAKTDGQRWKRGQWVFGDLVRLQDGNDGKPHIYGYGEVFPETVGQYTGICDKNGRKIFEGDIIKCSIIYDIGCYPHSETEIKEVKYIEGCFMPLYDCERNTYEVIGNIYDNPDLIK